MKGVHHQPVDARHRLLETLTTRAVVEVYVNDTWLRTDGRTQPQEIYLLFAHTYDSIHRRNRSLQVKFHSHLNSMEESLNATRKEKAEVEVLTRQLETGKTKAALELQVPYEYTNSLNIPSFS